MLHCTSPKEYLPAKSLGEVGICPDCSNKLILAIGVIHLAHYVNNDGTSVEGLLWLCSDKCFLSFEARQFMGRC